MPLVFDYDTICVIWFILLGVLLMGYAILDGFDLGVGIMHLLIARSDNDRRMMMNSIGPLWDGNEVWLVTFGGALFAAFPPAYASIFSGFYTAFMLLLFALILRAVSMEFRSKVESDAWRKIWDLLFSLGSFLATLLFGVAVGNAMLGLPIQANQELNIGVLHLLRPYPILVGLLAVSMFAMHGTIYTYLRTTGDLQQRCVPWMWRTYGLFLILFLLVTIATLVYIPRSTHNIHQYPILWIVPVLNILAIANIPRMIHKHRPGWAFISSTCAIAAFVFLLMTALFPNLVTAAGDPTRSITIWPGSAASSIKTLHIMFLIALLGMPCVLAYTAVIYWTFRGKVELSDHSY